MIFTVLFLVVSDMDLWANWKNRAQSSNTWILIKSRPHYQNQNILTSLLDYHVFKILYTVHLNFF